MWLAWLVSGAAWAQGCPDLAERVDEAWLQFMDAETEAAAAALSEAHDAVLCQQSLLATEDLVRLYQLDALTALTDGDRPSAVYATIRSVAADPDAAPDDSLGPVMAELYETWKARLAGNQVELTITGGGEIWVDGRKAQAGTPLTVVEGEHVVQVLDLDSWTNTLFEVAGDTEYATGIAPLMPEEPELPEVGPEEPEKTRRPKKTKEPRAAGTGRKHRGGLIVAGLSSAALGAGSLTLAFLQEQAFAADDYRPSRYNDCTPGTACYQTAREDAIQADATRINVLYGVGYGLVGVGVVVTGLELFVLPAPTQGGGKLLINGRF